MKRKKKDELVSKGTVMSALLMLLVTAVALTTATYAWFTANANVSIDSLDVNVAASNGLQISVDGVNWKSQISTTDITTAAYQGNTNQLPTAIVPVSTDLTLTSDGKLEMFKGAVDESKGTPILTSTATGEAAGTTGDFIAFDVFLQVSQKTKIQLATGADVTKKTDSSDTGLKNAARVCFVEQGHANVGTAASSYITLNGNTASNKKLWEPNADAHTDAAIQAAQNTYNKTITSGDMNATSTYLGLTSAFDLEQNAALTTENATFVTSVAPEIRTKAGRGETTANDIFEVEAGVTKVRIYCWVEGQDYDCENNASGTDISYKINLTKVDSTTTTT
jgi:hypothetical protein